MADNIFKRWTSKRGQEIADSGAPLSEIAEMLSDRELRERLKTEPDAATVHRLIANWEPLKSVA